MVNLTKSKVFVSLTVVFALGIFLASIYRIDQKIILVSEAVFLTVFALTYLARKKIILLVSVTGFVLFFGCLRLNLALKESEFKSLLNTEVELRGKIVQEADLRENRQLLTFAPENFSQKILITTNFNSYYAYGDQIVLFGKLVEAKVGNEFDYNAFLRKDNIYALSSYPKILVLKIAQGNWLKTGLLKIKSKFSENLNKYLAKQDSNLILGILVGARRQLSATTIENFNRSGLSHVLSVSGFNISIILTSLGGVLAFFGRRWQFTVGSALVLGFVVIAGASASVVRAAIMGSLVLVAQVLGRPYKNATALCLAGAVMLFLNPLILFWDVGFSLSFLATVGIIYGVNLLEKLSPNIAPWFGIKTLFLTSLCAIVMTMPLVANLFGNISLVALPANLVVVPLVPLVMLFSFLTILPVLAPGFVFITKICIDTMLWLVDFFSNLPYASLNLKIGFMTTFFCYFGIVCLYIFLKKLGKKITVEQKSNS